MNLFKIYVHKGFVFVLVEFIIIKKKTLGEKEPKSYAKAIF
jgi:hypothetical protein